MREEISVDPNLEEVGSGAKTFVELTDTPSTLNNEGGNLVAVNPEGDGLGFISRPKNRVYSYAFTGDITLSSSLSYLTFADLTVVPGRGYVINANLNIYAASTADRKGQLLMVVKTAGPSTRSTTPTSGGGGGGTIHSWTAFPYDSSDSGGYEGIAAAPIFVRPKAGETNLRIWLQPQVPGRSNPAWAIHGAPPARGTFSVIELPESEVISGRSFV